MNKTIVEFISKNEIVSNSEIFEFIEDNYASLLDAGSNLAANKKKVYRLLKKLCAEPKCILKSINYEDAKIYGYNKSKGPGNIPLYYLLTNSKANYDVLYLLVENLLSSNKSKVKIAKLMLENKKLLPSEMVFLSENLVNQSINLELKSELIKLLEFNIINKSIIPSNSKFKINIFNFFNDFLSLDIIEDVKDISVYPSEYNYKLISRKGVIAILSIFDFDLVLKLLKRDLEKLNDYNDNNSNDLFNKSLIVNETYTQKGVSKLIYIDNMHLLLDILDDITDKYPKLKNILYTLVTDLKTNCKMDLND